MTEFSSFLNIYVTAARELGANPILISPVCICPTRETKEGERGEIEKALPEYGKEMELFAKREKLLFVDLYSKTLSHCRKIGEKNSQELYIEDQVHLSEKGADCYAELLADHIKSFIMETNMEG